VTGTAAVLVGAQVIAAILIMIGIRSLAQDHSRAGAHQIGAGAALWVLAELAAAPGWTDLLTHLRPWVGAAAAAVSCATVLNCSLLLLASLSNRSMTDERGTP
jgi:hypothetical protein